MTGLGERGYVAAIVNASSYSRCRAGRDSSPRAAPLSLVLLAALALGGCSFALPVSVARSVDPEPTGSIARPAIPATLSPDLTPEDWRRARAAMAVALDPQGNGSSASWDNPETGMKGVFQPVGIPFVKGDEICRSFIASYGSPAANGAKLQGSACRPSGGDWSLAALSPWKGEK